MNEFDLERYLNITAIIDELEQRKRETRLSIYNQTLATHVVYDELGMHTKAPKIEYIVSDNVVACELIDERIKRLKDKQKYFIRFVDTLPRNERESLLKGTASESIQEKALDEIYEIETAICFKYGYQPPDERISVSDNPLDDLDLMIEVLSA
ncbi:hypothetical protein [Enterococcus casseliflavus]|uniref:hypothetical protein n=1 Tax=Enterococcus casseliflavus TaxID=37734 RepID=UPI002953A82C|nr:hypothetical protein [Enterococcus casseliflavus]MDV7751737.1 hypothetical protein [Enterococcus casseliflavus]